MERDIANCSVSRYNSTGFCVPVLIKRPGSICGKYGCDVFNQKTAGIVRFQRFYFVLYFRPVIGLCAVISFTLAGERSSQLLCYQTCMRLFAPQRIAGFIKLIAEPAEQKRVGDKER